MNIKMSNKFAMEFASFGKEWWKEIGTKDQMNKNNKDMTTWNENTPFH